MLTMTYEQQRDELLGCLVDQDKVVFFWNQDTQLYEQVTAVVDVGKLVSIRVVSHQRPEAIMVKAPMDTKFYVAEVSRLVKRTKVGGVNVSQTMINILEAIAIAATPMQVAEIFRQASGQDITNGYAKQYLLKLAATNRIIRAKTLEARYQAI